jgi:hypothetical protein
MDWPDSTASMDKSSDYNRRDQTNRSNQVPQVEWEILDMEPVNNLRDSMPRGLEAVIAAKGGNTKY